MTTVTAANQKISISKLKIGRKAYKVSDIAEASKIYEASIGDRGSSEMPYGLLFNDAGEKVAYISYNGRVWQGNENTSGDEPLYCPSWARATKGNS
jgi:hypothetical protein